MKVNIKISKLILIIIGVILILSGCSMFEPISYTVTFEVDGGSEIVDISVLKSSTPKLPDDPHKDGFIFEGWFFDNAFLREYKSIDIDLYLRNNILTLYAKWQIETYTIIFDGNGGNLIIGENNQLIEYGNEIEEPIFERPGYIFLGWTESFADIKSDLTLIAVWQQLFFTAKSVIYDGEYHSLEISGLPDNADVSYSLNQVKDAGYYEISATINNLYTEPYVMLSTLEIKPRPIEIRALNQEKYFGENEPELDYIITSGELIEGDYLEGEIERQYGEAIGEYNIDQGSLFGKNYEITFISGKLEIKPLNITGVIFENMSVVYDGEEHTIEVSGLTSAMSVSYINNSATNAGIYNAEAVISKENHSTLRLYATLTIEGLDFEGLAMDNKTVIYNGEYQYLEIFNLFDGAEVNYNQQAKNVGEYNITAVISKLNYKDLEIEATLTIEPAEAYVYIENAVKEVGEADPEIDFWIDGLIGEDIVTGIPKRAQGEHGGQYIYNLGTLANSNYTLILMTESYLTIDVTNVIENVIAYGMTLMGVPYVYGAERQFDSNGNPNPDFSMNAFDCSSFLQHIFYVGAGIILPTNSRTQSQIGIEVQMSDLQRGDIIFMTTDLRQWYWGINRIGHVGIYLGDGNILHTSYGKGGVNIEEYTTYRQGRTEIIKRFI